jgi:hypothetical protein
MGLLTGNGDVTLNLHANVKDGLAGVNLAGQIRNPTNGANCNITKIVKTGVGLVNIGSGTPGNTFVADIYVNEGCLSIVGKQANLIAGNRLHMNTNTSLGSANQAIGDYVGVTNFWNGDFSFNDSTYFSVLQQMSFGSGCRVDLGATGTDAVRTLNVVGDQGFTLNCPIVDGSNGTTKGFKKIGAGRMSLGGTNTFTDTFIVTNGTVTLTVTNCMAATNLQVIAPGIVFCRTNYCFPPNVTINLDGSYGKMRLSNNVPQVVTAFYTNGVAQASGTWGATGSGCANTNDNCFLGTGVISVP